MAAPEKLRLFVAIFPPGEIVEGLQKAEQYRALAHRSDAELAKRGLRRDELLRFIMFVKH